MDDDVQMEEFQPANDSTELQPVQQYERFGKIRYIYQLPCFYLSQ